MSSDPGVFPAGMRALKELSDVVGPELNPHVKLFLSQVAVIVSINLPGLILCLFLHISQLAKYTSSKVHGDQVIDLLQTLEANGGVVCIVRQFFEWHLCVE